MNRLSRISTFRESDILLYLIALYFVMDYLQYISKDLRYIKYLYPFVVGALSLLHQEPFLSPFKRKVYHYIKQILLLYTWLYFINLLVAICFNDVSFRFFANAFFVIAPLASVGLLIPYYKSYNNRLYFKVIFWGSTVGFCLEQGPSILKVFSNFNLTSLLRDSVSQTESNIYPFIFGFIFLFTVIQNHRLLYKVLSIIFLVLGSKRVVLLSIFILVCLSFFYKSKSSYVIDKRKWRLEWVFVALSLAIVCFYFFFAHGYFDDAIEDIFEVNANHLTQGRQFLYLGVLSNISVFEQLMGQGLGTVDREVSILTADRELGKINNLHSEILRNYIELGLVLFSVWVYRKIKIVCVSKFTFFTMVFLFISLITDNILIYFECMFVMYFLIVISLYDTECFRRFQTKS